MTMNPLAERGIPLDDQLPTRRELEIVPLAP